jgi:hypothetical protein
MLSLKISVPQQRRQCCGEIAACLIVVFRSVVNFCSDHPFPKPRSAAKMRFTGNADANAQHIRPRNGPFQYMAVLMPDDAISPRNVAPLPDWYDPEEEINRVTFIADHPRDPQCLTHLQAIHELIVWIEEHWYKPLVHGAKEHRGRLLDWASLLPWEEGDFPMIPTADSQQTAVEKELAGDAPEYPDIDDDDEDSELDIWVFNLRDTRWQNKVLCRSCGEINIYSIWIECLILQRVRELCLAGHMRPEDYPLGFGHDREGESCPQCEEVSQCWAEAGDAMHLCIADAGLFGLLQSR